MCRSDAYKHLEVSAADRNLQVLRMGNRFFIEEKITFQIPANTLNFIKH